jgi:hypothetical protein
MLRRDIGKHTEFLMTADATRAAAREDTKMT